MPVPKEPGFPKSPSRHPSHRTDRRPTPIDLVARSGRLKRDFMIERLKARYPQPFEITPSIKTAIVRLIQKDECDGYAISVDALEAKLRKDKFRMPVVWVHVSRFRHLLLAGQRPKS